MKKVLIPRVKGDHFENYWKMNNENVQGEVTIPGRTGILGKKINKNLGIMLFRRG